MQDHPLISPKREKGGGDAYLNAIGLKPNSQSKNLFQNAFLHEASGHSSFPFGSRGVPSLCYAKTFGYVFCVPMNAHKIHAAYGKHMAVLSPELAC